MKKLVKKNKFTYFTALTLYVFYKNIQRYFSEKESYDAYRNQIEEIIKSKEIVFDIEFGGLGDWLAFTTLPRLLKQKYDINFYISEESLERLRNKQTYEICFESNPYFSGTKKSENVFKYRNFEREKSLFYFLFDIKSPSVTEKIEKQFNVSERGFPEIYFKPTILKEYEKTILIDKNYISGKKIGWSYKDKTFEKEVAKLNTENIYTVEYIDPAKQDMITYLNMIYSCKHFITVLSGGAALASSLDKDFTVILPENIIGTSVDQFVFKKSRAKYV
jgi:hypothetical protein